jgi:hypothetical protein
MQAHCRQRPVRDTLTAAASAPSRKLDPGRALVFWTVELVAFALTLSIMLVAAADASGQVGGKVRRSRLGLRVVVSVLAAPAFLFFLTVGAALHVLPEQTSLVAFVLMILCSPALLLAPSVLYRTPDSAPGDADSGGGSDPGQPPPVPGRPSGDLPLPSAEPGRWRVRDHRRDLRHARPRRSVPEPDRAPIPASPVGQRPRP